jgi:hypothetical protein
MSEGSQNCAFCKRTPKEAGLEGGGVFMVGLIDTADKLCEACGKSHLRSFKTSRSFHYCKEHREEVMALADEWLASIGGKA